jgi:hypothetical protein
MNREAEYAADGAEGLIPEFPMVVLPVVGTLALFGVARYRHREA